MSKLTHSSMRLWQFFKIGTSWPSSHVENSSSRSRTMTEREPENLASRKVDSSELQSYGSKVNIGFPLLSF